MLCRAINLPVAAKLQRNSLKSTIRTMATSDDLLAASCKSLGACSVTPLVPKEKVQELLKKMPNWMLSSDEKSISRQFSTKDFVSALKFLNQAGEVAEEEGHHPDLHIRNYRDVEVVLNTHAVGGLTMFDFIVATKLDAIHVEVFQKKVTHD